MNKILLSTISILIVFISACGIEEATTTQNASNISTESTCTNLGGTWLAEYNECEGISQENCTELGGTFDECASACRHATGRTACTMQCVQVCSFE